MDTNTDSGYSFVHATLGFSRPDRHVKLYKSQQWKWNCFTHLVHWLFCQRCLLNETTRLLWFLILLRYFMSSMIVERGREVWARDAAKVRFKLGSFGQPSVNFCCNTMQRHAATACTGQSNMCKSTFLLDYFVMWTLVEVCHWLSTG